MQDVSYAKQGWDFAANLIGANVGTQKGADYIDAVENAIRELEEAVNYHEHRNNTLATFQGFLAEDWSAGTFNIDAVAKGSADRANVLHSTDPFSVDVNLASGSEYSMKSYADGAKDAVQQARFNHETGLGGYDGQAKWVPTDHLKDAYDKADHEYKRNILTRKEVSDSYLETRYSLTDVVKNDEGVTSRRATREDLDKMAKAGKEQSFRAEDYGVTAENSINYDYIKHKAMEAGYTAAIVTITMQLAPEIYKSIDYLIKNGELDLAQIQKSGEKAVSGGAEGFLRGSIAYYIQSVCDAGVLGEAFRNLDPTIVGAIVAISIQTIKNSILVAAGKLTARQMGAAFADSIIITSGFIVGTKVGGAIGAILGWEAPVLGYMIGSLVGTAFSVVYNVGKKKLISFCVDTGFTCFGLVDQDYELPEEILNKIGISTIEIPRKVTPHKQVNTTSVYKKVNTVDYETIDITVLKRGVIGVNRIGYVVS